MSVEVGFVKSDESVIRDEETIRGYFHGVFEERGSSDKVAAFFARCSKEVCVDGDRLTIDIPFKGQESLTTRLIFNNREEPRDGLLEVVSFHGDPENIISSNYIAFDKWMGLSVIKRPDGDEVVQLAPGLNRAGIVYIKEDGEIAVTDAEALVISLV